MFARWVYVAGIGIGVALNAFLFVVPIGRAAGVRPPAAAPSGRKDPPPLRPVVVQVQYDVTAVIPPGSVGPAAAIRGYDEKLVSLLRLEVAPEVLLAAARVLAFRFVLLDPKDRIVCALDLNAAGEFSPSGGEEYDGYSNRARIVSAPDILARVRTMAYESDLRLGYLVPIEVYERFREEQQRAAGAAGVAADGVAAYYGSFEARKGYAPVITAIRLADGSKRRVG